MNADRNVAVRVTRRLVPYLLRYKSRMAWSFLCMGMVALFSAASLVMLKPVLDVLFMPDEVAGLAVWTVPVARQDELGAGISRFREVRSCMAFPADASGQVQLQATVAGTSNADFRVRAASIAAELGLPAPNLLEAGAAFVQIGKTHSIDDVAAAADDTGWFARVSRLRADMKDRVLGGLYRWIAAYRAGGGSDYSILLAIAAVLIVLIGLKGLFSYLKDYLISWVGNKVEMDLRIDVFQHICSFSLRRFHRQGVGELMSYIANDVQLLRSSTFDVVGKAIQEPLTILGYLAVLLWIDARLTLIALLATPVTALVISRFGRRVKLARRKAQAHLSEINAVQQEAYSGIRVVKAFGMEDYEARRFNAASRNTFRMLMKSARARAASSPVIEFLGALAVGGTLVLGGWFVTSARLEGSDFLTFLAGLAMLYQPAKQLSKAYNALMAGLAGGERVFDLLDSEPDIRDKPGAPALPPFREQIAFEHVSFGYLPGRPVVHDFTLTVRHGEVVALVGPSGAGKSTLVNLLMRMFDVDEGSIRIDGTDIRDVRQRSLREQFGIVPQDTILFNDTLERNIAYGCETITRERVIAAARDASAHEFIAVMPEGYDTMVGAQGKTLSGGQAQRVAIARALAKDPPILIFDEATSSLDSESENLIRQALERLLVDRTTFLIAHRLSTVVHADRIVVMEEGRIADVGRHEELLERCPLYARLCRLQHLGAPTGP